LFGLGHFPQEFVGDVLDGGGVCLSDGHLEAAGLGVHVTDVHAALVVEQDRIRVAVRVNAHIRLLFLKGNNPNNNSTAM